jgi:O-antigen/teichoic acid export membrane protein
MKNKAWVYFSTSGTSLVCVVLGCVSGILAARLLKVEGRGELAAIAYFPGLMAAFFPLAMPQALTFFVSKEPHRKEEIAAAGFRISLLFGIVGAVAIAFLSKYTLTAENRHLAKSIALVCLMAPAMVVNPHLYAIHRGVHRFSLVNGLLISVAAGYILLLGVLGLTNMASAFTVAVGMQCLQIAVAIISAWCIGSCLFRIRVEWSTYKLCLLQGLKFWLPALALTLFVISDRAILIRTTTLKQMGYYAAAFAVGFPFSLVSEGFAQIGFVEISGTNNRQIASDLLARRFQMVQVVALCAVLAGLPLIRMVIQYGFGKEFIAAVPVAYFVVIAMALRGLSWTLECGLRAKNLIRPGIAANLTSFGCLVFFAALLVPSGKAEGFGIALLLAQSIGLAVMVVATKRSLGIPFPQLYGIRPAIIAALSRNMVSLIKSRGTDAHSYNAATSQL